VTNREIIICRDIGELSRKAAEQFVALARQAIAAHGRFSVALSGGSTPKALYSTLATAEFNLQLAWRQIHLFWVMSAVWRRIMPRAIFAWSKNRCCRR